jgi:Do/DeqQ family serine protease
LKPSVLPLGRALAENPDTSPYASALSVQEAFRAVSAEVLPTVVEVSVRAQGVASQPEGRELPWNEFFQDPARPNESPKYFQSQGLGTGVVIERNQDTYYVITNAHVVGESEEISVKLFDGTKAKASLVGRDERKDLALLSFDHPESSLPVIRLGDSDRIYVGDWVLAFGSPYGYDHSVSSGIISALGRRDGPGENINDFIQTDASINQGNSGGPLVNIQGEMIGVNTFITTPNSGSIGLGFAIPANNIRNTFRQLIDTGEVKYGWLGVSLGSYGAEAAESLGYLVGEGVMVYQVFDGSPGNQAGLRPGDLIVALDGRPAGDNERLIYRIGDKAPGEKAVFTINRLGITISVIAVIGTREAEDEVRAMHGRAHPGFVAAPLISELRTAMKLPEDIVGVPVAEVYPRTFAQSVDLRPGDIIVKVNGRDIADLAGLYRVLGDSRSDGISYTIFRNGEIIKLQKQSEAAALP